MKSVMPVEASSLCTRDRIEGAEKPTRDRSSEHTIRSGLTILARIIARELMRGEREKMGISVPDADREVR